MVDCLSSWAWSLLYLPSLLGWLIQSSRLKYHPYAVDSLHLYFYPSPSPWSGLMAHVSTQMSNRHLQLFLPVSPIFVNGNFTLSVAQAKVVRTTFDLTLSHHTFNSSAFCRLYFKICPDSQFSSLCLRYCHLISMEMATLLSLLTINSQTVFAELHLNRNLGHCLAAH